jgi:ribulose-bisphosphate carboxylase large chain
MGTLWRLAGADCVVYVNARGRFAWPVEACLAVNEAARAPLGSHPAAFPVPAGGIQAAEVDHWFDLYGPDTLLLIGGSILEADDVEGAAREVVAAARVAGGRAGECTGETAGERGA